MNKNEMVFKTIRMAETIEKHTWDRLPVWFTAPAGKIINRLILKIMGISEEQVAEIQGKSRTVGKLIPTHWTVS
jgi:uroporphyrinogen-III decarboxylase